MVPNKVILHCTASPDGKDYTIEQLERDHKARGFLGIGYHGVITYDGKFYNTRPYDKVGAHCIGENAQAIGIALVGTNKFSRDQFQALSDNLDTIFHRFSLCSHDLFGHYQFASAIKQGKTCPNLSIELIRKWYDDGDDALIAEYLLEKK